MGARGTSAQHQYVELQIGGARNRILRRNLSCGGHQGVQFSTDNWQGAGGTPGTGGGTVERDCRAPWLPSPAPLSLSAAILVSNDGEGGAESTGLGTKSLYAGATGLPCRSDAQHPATTLSAQRAPHIPSALWHTEGHLPPCFTKSRMWAPWQGGYRVPTGTTLALVSPVNWR